MNLSDFDYRLPEELIAQQPLADRAGSRMLVLDRRTRKFEDRLFRDLPSFLRPGDCLALNDTRVFPSRLLGVLEGTERPVEVFLLRPLGADRRTWQALVKPGKRMKPGGRAQFASGLTAEVLSVAGRGERVVRLEAPGEFEQALEQAGHVPLPPYIHRPDHQEDRERYQTVYAANRGSVAAPTAGLHFTPDMLEACQAAGAQIARITLHVGLGTFQPLGSDQVEENHLHSERFEINEEAAAALRAAQRIVAVGTTSARTLESAMRRGGIAPMSGETDLYLYPGAEFQAVGALLTNFHLPKSSLLLLVCALAGRDLTLAAYNHAVQERYRFFSYGDCMLIL
jgi:S-adenosylmethionine:tRNA ribosyltransferase-isomerase